MKRLLVAFFIIIAIVPFVVLGASSKPSIQYATVHDLESVYGIGDKLAISIHDYVQKHDVDRVSELEGQIKYLGEKRLEELEDIYR